MYTHAVDEIIRNFWFFQTESVVPLFVKFSLVILVIFAIGFVLSYFISWFLDSRKRRVLWGLASFPIMCLFCYLIFYFVGPFFHLDFSQLNFSRIIDAVIKCWWCFIVFPIIDIIFKAPFKILEMKIFKTKLFNSIQNSQTAISSALRMGIFEEISFRFLAINTIYLITQSLEIALLISAIIFSIYHLPKIFDGRWFGPVAINYTLLGGVVYGLIAVKFGLVFSIILHILNNILSYILGNILGEKDMSSTKQNKLKKV